MNWFRCSGDNGGQSSGSEVIVNEYRSQAGGDFSYSKTVTIQESGTYLINAFSYSNSPSLKINNISQSLTFYNSGNYFYAYMLEVQLSVNDVIDYSVNSDGNSFAGLSIIKQ